MHHRPALCTTALHCAPWCTWGNYSIFVVDNEHANQGSQYSSVTMHTSIGSAQRSFVLIRWCTKQFSIFVISFDHDGAGAQCNIVSLVVSVCLSTDHGKRKRGNRLARWNARVHFQFSISIKDICCSWMPISKTLLRYS